MPTAFMLYCRLVFWAVLSSSVSRANSIISIIVVIAGTAMLFAPSFGMTIDASALVTTLRSPMFLAVLVGSVILVRLVCVQYWIWTKERDARIKAEETITQLEQRRAILDAGKPYPIGISDAVSWSAVFRSSEMEVAQEPPAKRMEENSRQLRSTEVPSWRESAAWLLLCTTLVGVGLYITGELSARLGLGARARGRTLAFL